MMIIKLSVVQDSVELIEDEVAAMCTRNSLNRYLLSWAYFVGLGSIEFLLQQIKKGAQRC